MPYHRLSPVASMQFAHDALDMNFDSILGNVKRMSDPLIGPPVLEGSQNLQFSHSKDRV